MQIIKTGKHVADNGQAYDFSAEIMAQAAKVYDPELHEAPLVVGHPDSDKPAYGWVKGLAFNSGGLEAQTGQVDSQFAEMVNSGAFKKRSASFYPPDSPHNPVPGSYYLRHVGFLGAQAPAVKGLRDFQFAEDEDGVIVFSEAIQFTEFTDRILTRIVRRFRDWLVAKEGLEEADKIISPFDVEMLDEENARQAVNDSPAPAFNEPQPDPAPEEGGGDPENNPEEIMKTPEVLAQEAELERQKTAQANTQTELDARDAALNLQEAKARKAEISAHLDGLVAEAKVLPAEKDGLIAFMESLGADGGDAISFGEGDAKTQDAYFREFLDGLGKRAELSEVAGGTGGPVSGNPQEIANLAVAFQEEQRRNGLTISTTQAVKHVMAGASA